MRALYISSFHPVFEYNHLLTLNDLNIDWFSTGIYLNPNKKLNNSEHLNLRSNFKIEPKLDLIASFLTLNPTYFNQFCGLTVPLPIINKEFVDNFDIIILCHTRVLFNHWEDLKHKPIFLITCGNTHSLEPKLKPYVDKGVHIVRGSPQELKILNCNKSDIIPCFIDENIYKDWRARGDYVLSFQSHFKQRRFTLPVKSYLTLIKNFNYKLYGAYPKNLKDSMVISKISWEEQIKEYQNCGIYFCISNGLAPVTFNFLEALVLGAPVVCFGPKIGNSTMVSRGLPAIYEQHLLLENKVDGFYSDNINELKDYMRNLLDNKKLSKKIGDCGRKKGISLFSREVIKNKWYALIQKYV